MNSKIKNRKKDANKIADVLPLEIFEQKPSRAELRKFQLIESAISIYANTGIDKVTFDTIAKRNKVSRTLVQHYFGDQQSLVLMCAKFIRAKFQRSAVEAVRLSQEPKECLTKYIEAAFAWIEDYLDHAKVWLLFYHYCTVNPKVLAEHTVLTEMGRDRIVAMIKHFPGNDNVSAVVLHARAYFIQSIITGSLVTLKTEKAAINIDELKKMTICACLRSAVGDTDGL